MDDSEGKVAMKLFLSFLLAILTIVLLAAFFKVVSLCWQWLEDFEGKNVRLDTEHVNSDRTDLKLVDSYENLASKELLSPMQGALISHP